MKAGWIHYIFHIFHTRKEHFAERSKILEGYRSENF